MAEDMSVEELQRQLWAAVNAIVSAGFTLEPPPVITFSVRKPEGWKRHEVICHVGSREEVVERFWSWDRADDLCIRLNQIGMTQ
jgi:hypothetical protein